MGLRAEIEQDLAETLEGDYGLPVVLISPSGVRYSTSANDPTSSLMAQVLYDSASQDADGNTVIDSRPVITLRRSSLSVVPQSGERWAVEMPTGPEDDASTATFVVERALEGGRSIGFVRLLLRGTEQSS